MKQDIKLTGEEGYTERTSYSWTVADPQRCPCSIHWGLPIVTLHGKKSFEDEI